MVRDEVLGRVGFHDGRESGESQSLNVRVDEVQRGERVVEKVSAVSSHLHYLDDLDVCEGGVIAFEGWDVLRGKLETTSRSLNKPSTHVEQHVQKREGCIRRGCVQAGPQ